MNIESNLWKVVSYNDGYAMIIQKASGAVRTVSRNKLPDADALARMHERAFNTICREAFHAALR